MTKQFYTSIFTDKSGKVLYRLDYPVMTERGVTDPDSTRSLNKFFYEKEKAVALDKLVKERFLDKNSITIKDYEGQL